MTLPKEFITLFGTLVEHLPSDGLVGMIFDERERMVTYKWSTRAGDLGFSFKATIPLEDPEHIGQSLSEHWKYKYQHILLAKHKEKHGPVPADRP